MNSRLEFHLILLKLLGSNYVYFQAPASVKMQYPCIIYRRSGHNIKKANDIIYNKKTSYMVTLIDPNPDSELNDKLLNIPLCSFERHYTADNLNHDVYNIYY